MDDETSENMTVGSYSADENGDISVRISTNSAEETVKVPITSINYSGSDGTSTLTANIDGSLYVSNQNQWATTIGATNITMPYDYTVITHMNKLISYTKLNGLEEAIFIKQDDIIKFTRRKKKTIALQKRFPFFSISSISYTDLEYAIMDGNKKVVKHIYALESPTLLAKKFDLTYDKASSVDLIDDELAGN